MLDRLCDYHCHSQFSVDANQTMDDVLRFYTQHPHVKEVAFTDHFDRNDPYEKVETLISDEYFKHLEAMQKRYPDIRILRGIEVGVNRKNIEDTLKFLQQYNFDLVIASVHVFYVDGMNDREAGRHYPPLFMLKKYLEEALFVAQNFDRFNTLGHLDYIMRYYPLCEQDLLSCHSLILQILETLAKRNKALEINIAGYPHLGRAHPAPWILTEWQKLSGWVTLGSDAHRAEQLKSPYLYLGAKLIQRHKLQPIFCYDEKISLL